MSQNQKILDYLLSGKSLTPISALNKFGCFRLSARINDLRKKGHNIAHQHKDINEEWRMRLKEKIDNKEFEDNENGN